MAVVLIYRGAYFLAAGGGFRVVQWASSPGVDTPVRLNAQLQNRLGGAESKAQVEFSITDGTTVTDDKRVCTFHMVKLASGSPVDTWVEADFTGVESAIDAAWLAIKPLYQGFTKLSGIRWYKAGPQDAAPQEPVRVVDRDVVGTSAAGQQCPHQVAVSVTEQTSSRRAWGRFYLPSPNINLLNGSSGRYTSAGLTTIANAFDTMYEANKLANVPVVVYSAAKPARTTAAGTTLPAIAARALTVDQLQVDDVPDVIRTRRLKTTALKIQRAIA